MIDELALFEKSYIDEVCCVVIDDLPRIDRDVSSEFLERLVDFFSIYDSKLFSELVSGSIEQYGEIRIECPVSGKLATCRHSICMRHRNALRFESVEPFYIIQDNYTFEGIFFPSRKIFVHVKGCLSPEGKISSLADKILESEKSYRKYFSSNPDFGGVRISHSSPYHYYYFKMPALYDYVRGASKPVMLVSSCDGDYLDLKKVFKDRVSRYEIIDFHDGWQGSNIPVECHLNRFYFILGYRKTWVEKSVKDSLDHAVRESAVNNKEIVENIDDYDFKIWLGVTTGKRKWLEEIDSYKEVINYLSKKYRRVAVYVDGWTSSNNVSGWFPGKKMFKEDYECFFDLSEFANGFDGVDVVSVVGETANNKLIIGASVDFFIANHATGSLWISRVLAKKGITHTSNAARGSASQQHDHWNDVLVPKELVTDVFSKDDKNVFQVSYNIKVEEFMGFFRNVFETSF